MQGVSTRQQFDAIVDGLNGVVIDRVCCFEVEYETDEASYLDRPDIGHFLDYGVEWRLTDGTFRSFIWDNTFYPYGVGLFSEPLESQVTESRKWDVTHSAEWQPLVRQPVSAATAFRSCVEEPTGNSRTYYPQDLRITFGSIQSIYICAAQYLESSDQIMGLSDEIMVVFSEDIARRHKLGSFAEKA